MFKTPNLWYFCHGEFHPPKLTNTDVLQIYNPHPWSGKSLRCIFHTISQVSPGTMCQWTLVIIDLIMNFHWLSFFLRLSSHFLPCVSYISKVNYFTLESCLKICFFGHPNGNSLIGLKIYKALPWVISSENNTTKRVQYFCTLVFNRLKWDPKMRNQSLIPKRICEKKSVCMSILKIVVPQCLRGLGLNWDRVFGFSFLDFFFFKTLVVNFIHTPNKLLVSK